MTVEVQPQTIYLKDYQAPEFLIETVHLQVDIGAEATRVTSTLAVKRNALSPARTNQLTLVGAELQTEKVTLDSVVLQDSAYQLTHTELTLSITQDSAVIETVVVIRPQKNTSLEGLYASGTMLCTQCEAEGFRKITWYLDRPDVMAVFTTRIEADKATYPVLLSNGNPTDSGDLTDGRHFAEWFDPFKKPAYLFALVAGDLVRSDSSFETLSGRHVSLQLFVEAHNAAKTDFAHGALQRSMAWDEKAYGREYDLDLYMIVASDYFNMGAMENKGLNIFNSSRVLAHSDTTTDTQFQDIEAVIGHEYFHNWSGNRVTLRDWFQLSLKEGFTVFRDSQFTAELHSAAVKRMDDVSVLKTMQFAEDASPMAHSVRPSSYIEINNFYTTTIYDKGAEVVGMVHTLLGADLFRKGADHYFEHHDGEAATIEDFIGSMQSVSGFDFSQFMLWYEQAGTPQVAVSDRYNSERQEYRLTIQQSLAATPGQPDKQPMLIPIKLGLLDAAGKDMAIRVSPASAWNADTGVLLVTEAEQTFVFENVTSKPVPSLLRDFSAPVNLSFDYKTDELAFLMAHDSNAFNQWDASQRLAFNVLLSNITRAHAGETLDLPDAFLFALSAVLRDNKLDNAVVARMLTLPPESQLLERMAVADIDAIHQARSFVKRQIAESLRPELEARFHSLNDGRVYEFDASGMADRALKNLCLDYLMTLEDNQYVELAWKQYHHSNNFTDQAAAIGALSEVADPRVRESLYKSFIDVWASDSLMVEHWLGVQAASSKSDVTAVRALMASPRFDISNPNQVRSVVGRFSRSNLTQFHKPDGSGYKFLADQIIVLNRVNPQTAGRMVGGFRVLPRLDANRQELVRAQLQRILELEQLSPDVYEVASRIAKS